MSLLKSVFGSFLRRSPGTTRGGESLEFDLPQQADIVFDTTDPVQDAISQLWTSCQEVGSPRGEQGTLARHVVLHFFEQLLEQFQGWQPDDAAFEDEAKRLIIEESHRLRAQAAEAGSGGGSGGGIAAAVLSGVTANAPPPPHVTLLGCRGGLPAGVVEALVQALRQLPNDFSQAVRREAASVEDLDRAVGVHLLVVAAMVCRSHYSRQVFERSGGIPALARIMKVSLMRLNTVAAILEVEQAHGAPRHVQAQLAFLTQLLASCVAACNGFLAHGLRYARWDAGRTTTTAAAASSSIGDAESDSCGNAQPAAARGGFGAAAPWASPPGGEACCYPLVVEGVVAMYVELVQALHLVCARAGGNSGGGMGSGGGVRAPAAAAEAAGLRSLEVSALRGLAAATAVSAAARASVGSAGGMRVMADGLGWPGGLAQQHGGRSSGGSGGGSGSPRWAAAGHGGSRAGSRAGIGDGSTPRGGSHAPDDEELLSQLLTLQVLGQCAAHHKNNLSRLREAGGLERTTQLLQWAALCYSGTTASSSGTTASSSGTTSSSSGTTGSSSGPNAGAGSISPPTDGRRGRIDSSDAAPAAGTSSSSGLQRSRPPSAAAQGGDVGDGDGAPWFEPRAVCALSLAGGSLEMALDGLDREEEEEEGGGGGRGRRSMRSPFFSGGGRRRGSSRVRSGDGDLGNMEGDGAAAPPPGSWQLQALVLELALWVAPEPVAAAGGGATSRSSDGDASHIDRAMRHVAKALLDSFQPATPSSGLLNNSRDATAHAAVIRMLYRESCMLQRYTLLLLQHLMRTQPAACAHGLAAASWQDVLFGPAFFYHGWRESAQRRRSEGSVECWQALPSGPEARAAEGDPARQLRTHVLETMQCAAMVPGLQGDVAKVLRLLRDSPLHYEVVVAAAPALTSVLTRAPGAVAMDLLEQHAMLDVLAQVLDTQRRAALPPPPEPPSAPSTTASTPAANNVSSGGRTAAPEPGMCSTDASASATNYGSSGGGGSGGGGDGGNDEDDRPARQQARVAAVREARSAVLTLLAMLLDVCVPARRAAAQHAQLMDGLFALLWESGTRRVALRMIVRTLSCVAESPEEHAAKAALVARYVQDAVPSAMECWREAGTGLIDDLLLGMREALAWDSPTHQALFREAGCFVQVLHLLNQDYPPALGAPLAEAVISTLRCLVAGNPDSRHIFAAEVGFDTLQRAVAERAGPGGPSRPLLEQVLGLALEREYRDDDLRQGDADDGEATAPGWVLPSLPSSPSLSSSPSGGPPLLQLLPPTPPTPTVSQPQRAGGKGQLASATPAAATQQQLQRRRASVKVVPEVACDGAVPLFFQLLRLSGAECRRWGLATWAMLLRGSVANLAVADRVHLNTMLLDWFSSPEASADPELQMRIADVLQAAGSYSMSARDLRTIIRLLCQPSSNSRGGGGRVNRQPASAPLLVRTLAAVAEQQRGPGSYFHFGGRQDAGIVRNAPFRALTSRGYSFTTWLRLEGGGDDAHGLQGSSSHPNQQQQPQARCLFALLCPAGPGSLPRGVAAAVRGDELIVYSLMGGSQPQGGAAATSPSSAYSEVTLEYRLPVGGGWAHLALVHGLGGGTGVGVGPVLGGAAAATLAGAGPAPGVHLYMDGAPVASAKLRYPKLNEPLTSAYIGAPLPQEATGLPGLALGGFPGQMGAVYLFDDSLNQAHVRSLSQLGPDYRLSLRASESSAASDQLTDHTYLADARTGICARMVLSYNAQAASGSAVFNTAAGAQEADAPPGAAAASAAVTSQEHASALPGTLRCVTHPLRDMLPCIGGVSVLLPMVARLDAQLGSSGEPPTPAPAAVPALTPWWPGVSGDGGAGDQLQARLPSSSSLSPPSPAQDVVTVMAAVLERSPANWSDAKQVQALSLMGHLLQQRSATHLTPGLVAALQRLLAAVARSDWLFSDALSGLVLPVDLWAPAPPATQMLLHAWYLRMAEEHTALFREKLSPAAILDAVRWHYWSVAGPDSQRQACDGVAVGPEELRQLRRGLLRVVRFMVDADCAAVPAGAPPSRAVQEDVQALLALLADSQDLVVAEDVAGCLHAMCQPGAPSQHLLLRCVNEQGGPHLFLPLARRGSAALRAMAVRLSALLRPSLGSSTTTGGGGGGFSAGPAVGAGAPAASAAAAAPGGPAGSGGDAAAAAATAVAAAGGAAQQKRGAVGFYCSLSDSLSEHQLERSVRSALIDVLLQGPGGGNGPAAISVGAGSVGGGGGGNVRGMGGDADGCCCPQMAGALLQLVRRCSSAGERLRALQALAAAVEDRPDVRAALLQLPGWQDWLLQLLTDVSPCVRSSSPADMSVAASSAGGHGGGGEEGGGAAGRRASRRQQQRPPWRWRGEEAACVRRLLLALHLHSVAEVPHGWQSVLTTLCVLRHYAEEGKVDAWGLSHELLADVLEALVPDAAAAAAAATGGKAGSVVTTPGSSARGSSGAPPSPFAAPPSLGASPCRENALGLLGLLDDLVAGVLVTPGQDPVVPPPAAIFWAARSEATTAAGPPHAATSSKAAAAHRPVSAGDGASSSSSSLSVSADGGGAVGAIPDSAWGSLRVRVGNFGWATERWMTGSCWRLLGALWPFMHTLHQVQQRQLLERAPSTLSAALSGLSSAASSSLSTLTSTTGQLLGTPLSALPSTWTPAAIYQRSSHSHQEPFSTSGHDSSPAGAAAAAAGGGGGGSGGGAGGVLAGNGFDRRSHSVEGVTGEGGHGSGGIYRGRSSSVQEGGVFAAGAARHYPVDASAQVDLGQMDWLLTSIFHTPRPGCPEEAVRSGLSSRLLRLAVRLLLLYAQFDDGDDMHCGVQHCMELLRGMASTQPDACRGRLHLALACLQQVSHELVASEGEEGGGLAPLGLPLSGGCSPRARMRLVDGIIMGLADSCGVLLADHRTSSSSGGGSGTAAAHSPGGGSGDRRGPLQQQLLPDVAQASDALALLHGSSAVAAAREEVQFLGHMSQAYASVTRLLSGMAGARAEHQSSLSERAQAMGGELLAAASSTERRRRVAARQAVADVQLQLGRRWDGVQRELSSEWGAWAAQHKGGGLSEVKRYKLDKTEDPQRRRMKLKRNFRYVRYDDSARVIPSASRRRLQEQPDPTDEELGALLKPYRATSSAQGGTLEDALDDALAETEAGQGGEQSEEGSGGGARRSQQSRPGQRGDDKGGSSWQEGSGRCSPARDNRGAGRGAGDDDGAAAAEVVASAGEAGPEADKAAEKDDAAAQVQLTAPPLSPPPPAAAAAEPAAAAFSTQCSLVTPKGVRPGRMDITPTELVFVPDPFDPLSEAGPQDVGAGGGGRPATPSTSSGGGGRGGGLPLRTKRWPLESLAKAHHSTHMLQHTALEIFFRRRTSALLNFPSQQAMHEASAALARSCPPLPGGAPAGGGAAGGGGVLPILDRKRKAEAVAALQAAWARWELSNFEYLMQLNSLAGRSYCDLDAYPVMPWVLADYSSDVLDLGSPSSYRDLSRPVGALDDSRLAFFQERFASLRGDPDTPPFHYGSHYSSAGIVLFYLIRMEPFTALNRSLQDGHFDVADRLFHDLGSTWRNCLEGSADVKELTPEFFCCPEFLRNSNDFNLGTRQDDVALGDVLLPPWARGSPEEFVRLHREALEGPHASANLHHWIDLVFGAKQRGKAAEEACNVFFYLTYEGAVDMDAIQNPRQKDAVLAQIRHFGQTPVQLFRRPHPARGPPPSPATRPLLNGPDAMRRVSVLLPPQARANVPVAAIGTAEGGRLVVVHADHHVSSFRWVLAADVAAAFTFGGTGAASGPDSSGMVLEPESSAPRPLAAGPAGGPSEAASVPGGAAAAAGASTAEPLPQRYCVVPGGRLILSCGYGDWSLRCHAFGDGSLVQCVTHHRDVVTCVAVAPDATLVVSGSRDTTLCVWATTLSPKGGRVKVRGRMLLPMSGAAPTRTLFGHTDAVITAAVHPDLDLVVSADAAGTVLLHCLSSGGVRVALPLRPGCSPRGLCVGQAQGLLVVHTSQDLSLSLFTINGRKLAEVQANERVRAMAPSPDGRFLLTGGSSGAATLRWMHSLQPVIRYEAGSCHVTALAVSPDECFAAGLATGAMAAFSPDARRKITARLALSSAS